MKKMVVLLLGAVLALGLTGCGQDKKADNNASSGAGSNAPATVETSEDVAVPTADELFTKMTDATKDLKSLSMAASSKQKVVIKVGEETQEQNIEMEIKSDIIQDPLAMMQELHMSMGDLGNQDVTQYVTADGIYMQTGGAWVKLTDETMMATLKDAAKQSADPSQQIEQFKSIANEMKVTEDGSDFVLKANLSGDNMKELAKSLMSQNGGENQADAMAAIDQMKIENINIVYSINKETYLPSKMSVEMKMDMEAEGQQVSMEMKMDSSFSKYNEIEAIEVPQEALDNAIVQ
ncbi:DUF6612 family protein [Paenibacillus lutimineralis]|uniref:LppX_LprAFG lipoprotein n=1 Tax=Paenibacillus lutimineralis TaxID=2707005 RepID=A0A3Q9I6Z7_9BACL|nr:DUF6612 family protein [Paenibacillus lutimineralis]AZS13940.1 hypothetical protein EI981_05400 [Paenibacillus lutimineralis]